MITTAMKSIVIEPNKIASVTETANNSELTINDQNKIVLSTRSGFIVIPCNDIIRVESNRAYCIFHLKDGTKIRASKSLKFYEPKLREWNFIKVHKSFMVNLMHIEGYLKGKSSCLLLSDNSMVPVSIRKRPRLHRLFTEQPELLSANRTSVAS